MESRRTILASVSGGDLALHRQPIVGGSANFITNTRQTIEDLSLIGSHLRTGDAELPAFQYEKLGRWQVQSRTEGKIPEK